MVYCKQVENWEKFFKTHGIEYFGDYFMEYDALKIALEAELQHIDLDTRRNLYYVFNTEGQTVIHYEDFMRIMTIWSSFTANDINNDNTLDLRELRMLLWLHMRAKPNRAVLQREIEIMDADMSGTIDRMEWVAYLASPPVGMFQLGNKNYYDFELREMFEQNVNNKNGLISPLAFREIIKTDFGIYYNALTAQNQMKAEYLFEILQI